MVKKADGDGIPMLLMLLIAAALIVGIIITEPPKNQTPAICSNFTAWFSNESVAEILDYGAMGYNVSIDLYTPEVCTDNKEKCWEAEKIDAVHTPCKKNVDVIRYIFEQEGI